MADHEPFKDRYVQLSWDSFFLSGVMRYGKFTYLNINQKLVNWIILIRHFVKPHRDPGIFSPVQVDGIDCPFGRTFCSKVGIDGDFFLPRTSYES